MLRDRAKMSAKKDKIMDDVIRPNLKLGEELIGFFFTIYAPTLKDALIGGPIQLLGGKVCLLAISALGIHIHILEVHERRHLFFDYSQIKKFKFESGFFDPMIIYFKSGEILRLRTRRRWIIGLRKYEKIDARIKNYLLSKVPRFL